MTININEVQEIIKNLESGGELSIKEEKYLKVAKLCVQLAAERDAALNAERAWEKTMMEVCGEDGHASVEAVINALAAENVALKLAMPEPRNVEFDNDSMDDVSLAEDVGFNDAIGQMKINISKTPATDRIVAGIKADGVEEFSKTLEGAADICGKSKAWEAQENLLDFAERGFDFAKQLREGDNHG